MQLQHFRSCGYFLFDVFYLYPNFHQRKKITLKKGNCVFLDQICPKRVSPVKVGEIAISIEFSLFELASLCIKQTVLIFWIKFAKKGYFLSKSRQMNITI